MGWPDGLRKNYLGFFDAVAMPWRGNETELDCAKRGTSNELVFRRIPD